MVIFPMIHAKDYIYIYIYTPKNKQFSNEKWCLKDSFLFDIVPFQANMLILLGGKMFDFCHMEKLTKYLSKIKKTFFPPENKRLEPEKS